VLDVLEPPPGSLSLLDGVIPRAMHLQYLCLVHVAPSREPDQVGLIVAPTPQRLGPFDRPPECETFVASFDHAAIHDACDHRGDVARRDSDHRLVEERNTDRRSTSSNVCAAFFAHRKGKEVVLTCALGRFGHAAGYLGRKLVRTFERCPDCFGHQEVCPFHVLSIQSIRQALATPEPASGGTDLASLQVSDSCPGRGADGIRKRIGTFVGEMGASDDADETVLATEHEGADSELLEVESRQRSLRLCNGERVVGVLPSLPGEERQRTLDGVRNGHVTPIIAPERRRRSNISVSLRSLVAVTHVYLDHAATTPMRPEVREAMEPFGEVSFGNASGSHGVSRRAKNALEEAREVVAGALGCRPQEIVFTSGGTEADNLAVKGAALAEGLGGVVTVATEHEAVLESAAFVKRLGAEVEVVAVDGTGRVDPAGIFEAVTDTTRVVSVMWANNETGTRQPLRQIRAGLGDTVLLHTDAVQAFISEDVSVEGVDMLSLSAHKFGGPKGVGVLYVKDGVRLEPVLHGGGQELGRRSGTHNVAGAVGLAAAVAATVSDRDAFRTRVEAIRRRFEHLIADVAVRTVPVEHSLVQHAHLRVSGRRNETMLVRLDQRGVAASSASACQSGANTVSHVLEAMNVQSPREYLRFSFGWNSTMEDAERAAAVIRDAAGEAA
jgi:cysteine desulfurase